VTATVRQLKRHAAKRPAARTITVTIAEGEYEGWEATARADFPASVLVDLESGRISRVIAALDAIVVDHNLPNAKDELAASMTEVDPYQGLLVIAGEIFDRLGKLPNR
jgi:hypothetical protein